ncbi:hypothetical protein OZN62_03680 [Aurantiacibacter sp. MUD11]|uniref:hypothetical protein n=1 Tax=Aurantiacibacter sp. MUD11 TaxID=3003265 RepID=UPI0022AA3DB2|nr:hypothetical protein [Aurantiacibacter sp. MUD11]WAT18686.1 hypothetical protein OZN62_03680 [Aurantiacibacter sp. MUD11]
MTTATNPKPDRQKRAAHARDVRNEATVLSRRRAKGLGTIKQKGNGEAGLVPPIASFSKSLQHDKYGIVTQSDFDQFLDQLGQDGPDRKTSRRFDDTCPSGRRAEFNVPLASGAERIFESPICGHYYELEGPDMDAVAMPPAPKVGSDELAVEMAEVYWMASLRDEHVSNLESGGNAQVTAAATSIGGMDWFTGPQPAKKREASRRQARLDDNGDLTLQTLFRGSTPGSKVGPYLSQFLLIGNEDRGSAANRFQIDTGMIQYGAQVVDQRVLPARYGKDYMTTWQSWLDVQNGKDTTDALEFEADGERRFIHKPRDLAHYVHFDALYQAYLNACLWMLSVGAPTDSGLPEGKGHPTRQGFATFGGPHILSLLTEVATRALKAVRRQKFQVHLRGRPEAIGGALCLSDSAQANKLGDFENAVASLRQQLSAAGVPLSQDAVGSPDFAPGQNWLLPMAFPEGSPVHGSYGAGHATVAGACVTMIKAFFEMYDLSAVSIGGASGPEGIYRGSNGLALPQMIANAPALFADELSLFDASRNKLQQFYVPNANGTALDAWGGDASGISLLGELDKLAANISIGRDWAGVHYYTDYYESLRLGERIAVGILQEQLLTWTEPMSMRFTSFDGDWIMLAGTGGDCHPGNGGVPEADPAQILVWPYDNRTPPWTTRSYASDKFNREVREEAAKWWNRALDDS